MSPHQLIVLLLPNGKDAASIGKFVIKWAILLLVLGAILAPALGGSSST